MRVSRLACVIVVGLLARTSIASAQTAEVQAVRDQIDQLRKDFDTLKQELGDRLTALEARLADIQGGQSAAAAPPSTPQPPGQTAQVPPGAEGAGGPAGTLPVYGTTGAAVSRTRYSTPTRRSSATSWAPRARTESIPIPRSRCTNPRWHSRQS